jgi:hypothetical protein
MHPNITSLIKNFPNPFNNSTTIDFEIPEKTNLKLLIYGSLGRELGTIIDQELSAGKHSIRFDAKNNPSGIYFYKLKTKRFISTMKMILMK